MILLRVRSSIDKLMISNLQNECARVAKFHLVIGTWVRSFQFTCQSLTLLLLEMTNSSHAKTFDNTFQYTHASMIRFVFMYLEERKNCSHVHINQKRAYARYCSGKFFNLKFNVEITIGSGGNAKCSNKLYVH